MSSSPSGNIGSHSYGGGSGSGDGFGRNAPNDDSSGNFLTFEKLDLDLDIGGSDGNLPSSLRGSDLDMDDLLAGLETSDGQIQEAVSSAGTGDDGHDVGGGGLLDLDVGGGGLLDLDVGGGGGDVANPSNDLLLGRLSNHGEQPPQHPPEMSSMEKLLTMDLIEVDDDKLRSELNEDLGIASSNYQQEQDTMLLQQQQQQQQPQTQYHQQQQFVNEAPPRSSAQQTMDLSGPGGPTAANNLVEMGSDDLEREKIKLLQQLEEIKRKKHQNQVQQSQLQQNIAVVGTGTRTAASALASGSGETPLQSFLRASNKGGSSLSPTNSGVGASMLGRSVANNGPPPVTSILDVAPMDVGFSGSSIPFMVQQERSSREVDIDHMGFSGQTANAGWGATPGLSRTAQMGASSRHSVTAASRMLPKHASEGILMRATGSSLGRSKNRVGSVSRENGLYDLLRNKRGSKSNLTSLSRQGSQRSLVRQGSQKSIGREGSFGSLFPVKRGSAATSMSKYKIGGLGASVSVPHMRMNSAYNRSTSPSYQGGGGGGQQNAMW
mmetsp:Transcript_29888/g.72436  ORF Transcript_29888/g.72436 Transcript_29888/m.72436 type:complete len:549 (+) Transcript_29888:325-1971(+)